MRAAKTDMLQGFRYHVTANIPGQSDPLQTVPNSDRADYATKGAAGFQSVTIPEISVEASEYREGIFKYTQKYPGPPTITEVTLMRGVTKRDTAFFDLVMASIDGKEYRADVTIYHYARDEMGLANAVETPSSVRRIICREAFAIRAKPEGDLDSMAGDVSLAEVDLAIESFELKPEGD